MWVGFKDSSGFWKINCIALKKLWSLSFKSLDNTLSFSNLIMPSFVLSNPATLSEGVYDITINITDEAGNEGSVTVSNVEYDITTLINTHDMNSVMEIGDKIIFLVEGKKIWEGTNTEILDTDDQMINDFVYSSELFKKVKLAQKKN